MLFRIVNGFTIGSQTEDFETVPAGRFVTPFLSHVMGMWALNQRAIWEYDGSHGDFSTILVMGDTKDVRDPLPGEKKGNWTFDEGEKVLTKPQRVIGTVGIYNKINGEYLGALSNEELDKLSLEQILFKPKEIIPQYGHHSQRKVNFSPRVSARYK